jgi:hypothetical protein
MFTPVSSQAQAFVPAHAAYPHLRNQAQGRGRGGYPGDGVMLYGAHGQPLPPQQGPPDSTLPPPHGLYQQAYGRPPPMDERGVPPPLHHMPPDQVSWVPPFRPTSLTDPVTSVNRVVAADRAPGLSTRIPRTSPPSLPPRLRPATRPDTIPRRATTRAPPRNRRTHMTGARLTAPVTPPCSLHTERRRRRRLRPAPPEAA